MQKLLEKTSVRIIVVGEHAYWVSENIFYTARIDDNGNIDLSEAHPVDVFSASEKETKRLLQILDSIKE